MTWLGFGSLKSSPGATTLAVVMAGLWPEPRRALLIEADLDGGSLAARFDLDPEEPGVVTLAAAGRHGIDRDAVMCNTQELPGGVRVLVGPPAGAQGAPPLDVLASQAATLQEELDGTDLFLDFGRLRQHSLGGELFEALDLLIVVVRPTFEELDRLLTRLPTMVEPGVPIGVVMMGSGTYCADDVEPVVSSETNGAVRVLGQVGYDPRGAAALNLGRGGPKTLRRSLLVRSTNSLVQALCS